MYDHDGSLHALEMVIFKARKKVSVFLLKPAFLFKLFQVSHPLQDHGELGDPPTDYGLTVKATNGHTYHVQVIII